MDPKALDDLSRRLVDAMPPGLKQVQDDVHKTFSSILQSGLHRMNLVTREDFDVQAGVLARTRSRLQDLEKQVSDLEGRISSEKKPARARKRPGGKPAT